MGKNGSVPDHFEWGPDADSTHAKIQVMALKHIHLEGRVDKLSEHFEPDGLVVAIDRKIDRVMTGIYLLAAGVPVVGAIIAGIVWLVHNAK